MPRPARSTGTSSGGLASRDPVVSASGVRTATLSVGRVAGGLVDQHQGQVAKRGPERRVVGALVAQRGQPRRGQRVVDDAHVHGRTLSVSGTDEPAAVRSSYPHARRHQMPILLRSARTARHQADRPVRRRRCPDVAAGSRGGRRVRSGRRRIPRRARRRDRRRMRGPSPRSSERVCASARSRAGVVADAYADADRARQPPPLAMPSATDRRAGGADPRGGGAGRAGVVGPGGTDRLAGRGARRCWPMSSAAARGGWSRTADGVVGRGRRRGGGLHVRRRPTRPTGCRCASTNCGRARPVPRTRWRGARSRLRRHRRPASRPARPHSNRISTSRVPPRSYGPRLGGRCRRRSRSSRSCAPNSTGMPPSVAAPTAPARLRRRRRAGFSVRRPDQARGRFGCRRTRRPRCSVGAVGAASLAIGRRTGALAADAGPRAVRRRRGGARCPTAAPRRHRTQSPRTPFATR